MASFKHLVLISAAALFLSGCDIVRTEVTTITVNGVTYTVHVEHFFSAPTNPSPDSSQYRIWIGSRIFDCGETLDLCRDVVERELRNLGDEGDGGGIGV